MQSKRWALVLLIAVMFSSLALAQDDKMVYASKATLKFGNMPVLPPCATSAVVHGDPSKGPSDIAAKTTSGCVVPWHWHTAAEKLYVVTGKGKVEMKDGGDSHVAGPGDYVYLPGKQTHQFTCVAACYFFISPEGAFDIHYVDASGNEIKPEDAFKKPSTGAMKKPSGAAKKKPAQ